MKQFANIISNLKLTCSALAAVFICAVLMSLLHTHGKLLLIEYLSYYLWFVPPVLMIEVIRRRYSVGDEQIVDNVNIAPGLILFVFLLILLCSSLNEHRWFFSWSGGMRIQPVSITLGLVLFGLCF